MPIDALRADGIDLTGYWYNPNIHPFTEYRARRNCLQEYAKTIGLPLLVRDDYGLRPFVRAVAEDISGRCVKCYEMRLFEAARMAKEGGFDAFTSSLFISPYQQHELMRDVAYRAAEEYGVQFYYQDFRPMFRDGQTRARELGFYIQKYCGCVFSEQERYQKPSRIIPSQALHIASARRAEPPVACFGCAEGAGCLRWPILFCLARKEWGEKRRWRTK